MGSMDGPKLLVEALQAKGLSQGDLERIIGCGDSLVSKWVNGRRTPGLEYALKLESVLGVPAASWVDVTLNAPTGTDG